MPSRGRPVTGLLLVEFFESVDELVDCGFFPPECAVDFDCFGCDAFGAPVVEGFGGDAESVCDFGCGEELLCHGSLYAPSSLPSVSRRDVAGTVVVSVLGRGVFGE